MCNIAVPYRVFFEDGRIQRSESVTEQRIADILFPIRSINLYDGRAENGQWEDAGAVRRRDCPVPIWDAEVDSGFLKGFSPIVWIPSCNRLGYVVKSLLFWSC